MAFRSIVSIMLSACVLHAKATHFPPEVLRFDVAAVQEPLQSVKQQLSKLHDQLKRAQHRAVEEVMAYKAFFQQQERKLFGGQNESDKTMSGAVETELGIGKLRREAGDLMKQNSNPKLAIRGILSNVSLAMELADDVSSRSDKVAKDWPKLQEHRSKNEMRTARTAKKQNLEATEGEANPNTGQGAGSRKKDSESDGKSTPQRPTTFRKFGVLL